MAAIQKQAVFDVLAVFCILKPVSPHELVDDGLGLFGRMVGGWWDVEVKIHGFLEGFGDNSASLDSDGEIEEDS